ncbi:MAG: glycoside hydrolase family 127 protein, partial [Prevotellaceae bacterium]|nr:glycoside hydrolase family 127 protein [Prevotellaceae bacterium]
YIPYIAVTDSKKGPVINLYNAAKVEMSTPAQNPLKLDIETDYPQSGKVLIRVTPDNPESFTLKLRIPAWSENTSVKVNGKKQTVAAGAYADITRAWKAGDRVEIVFDMRCRVIDSPHGTNRKGDNMQAVVYGPVVLARDENTDKEYNQPVTIKADKAGLVKATKTKPTLESTRMEFIVPTSKGTIRMIDYASVNNWDGSHICTWLPTHEHEHKH